MKKLTPADVRDIAKYLLNGTTNSISVSELRKALEEEGYKVHNTFCIGSCVAKDSGMYVMNNHIYKTRRMNHLEIKNRKLG